MAAMVEQQNATAEAVKNIDNGIHVDVEDSILPRLDDSGSKFAILSSEAKEATDVEYAMTLQQAIKGYPKAIAWSILLSTAITMEGYDLVLISSFYAFLTFTKKYGASKNGGKSYQIPAPWQAGLSNGAQVGEILGLFVNGINIETLEAAEILMGVPWGVFQTSTTVYAAEVCPVALRAYLTAYVNIMWCLGQLIAAGVLRAFLYRTDEWSPDEARVALRRLTTDASSSELDKTISMMQHTNELEKEVSTGTSYLDCFKGINPRRTEITCLTWVIQAASGASFMGYAAYFFEQAGLPTSIAFDFSISLYAVAMIGVLFSWFAMACFGRRTIYLSRLSAMFLILMAIGFVSLAPPSNHAASFATGSLPLLFTLCYDITIGSVTYSIVAEIPSTRLRTTTIVLARNLYNVQGIINGIITPHILNPTAWNWQGKAGFFWAGLAGICLLWSYFRLPEPKGRAYGELDLLFERGIRVRGTAEARRKKASLRDGRTEIIVAPT
ncbi:hypothetical protein BDZ45DRAFT_708808 [Acephala macrosclerotiorum]|nr:hypothetical protein BDZ45DRAFT_708808 [Acephala macrosclerotiorum]